MADAFIGTTGNASVYHVTALDLMTRWFLPRTVVFRKAVTSTPVSPDHNYKTITITVDGERTPSLTIPGETVTPDSIDIPATRQFTITLDEHMEVAKHTWLGDATSWKPTLQDTTVRQLLQWTADTVDLSVRTAMNAGTNVIYPLAAGGFQTTDPGDATRGVLNAKGVAVARARLRSRRADYFGSGRYLAFIHPNVAYDLFVEGGPGGAVWSYNTQTAYTDPGEIRSGTITTYSGVDFIESEQCTVAVPTADNVYTTYFTGQEAVMEAVRKEPTVALGPVVDPARRFTPIVSHGAYGHVIFRQNALELFKSESSLGAVAVTTIDAKA